jgi:hypothetical protein
MDLSPDTLGGRALSQVGAKLSELDGNWLRIPWEAFDEVARRLSPVIYPTCKPPPICGPM